jgi:hypothetical protein
MKQKNREVVRAKDISALRYFMCLSAVYIAERDVIGKETIQDQNSFYKISVPYATTHHKIRSVCVPAITAM